MAKVRGSESAFNSEALTEAVARSLFKLMAYKDEYEVARLHMQTGFLDELKREFEGDFSVTYHLAPPILPSERDARGRPRKRAFGQWIQMPLSFLAHLKMLRGTAFDPFGYTAERRAERELIGWYEGVIDQMLDGLDRDASARSPRNRQGPDGYPRLRPGERGRDCKGEARGRASARRIGSIVAAKDARLRLTGRRRGCSLRLEGDSLMASLQPGDASWISTSLTLTQCCGRASCQNGHQHGAHDRSARPSQDQC